MVRRHIFKIGIYWLVVVAIGAAFADCIIAQTCVANSGFSHRLIVTVIGEEPLIDLSAVPSSSADTGMITVGYSYQHAKTIDFLLSDPDSAVITAQRIDTSNNAEFGHGTVSFRTEQLTAGDYTVTAKLSGDRGNTKNTLSFSYNQEAVIFASATIPAATVEALEKSAIVTSAPSSAVPAITTTDRILTAVIVGLLTTAGAFFTLKKHGIIKPRSLVPDSSITFE